MKCCGLRQKRPSIRHMRTILAKKRSKLLLFALFKLVLVVVGLPVSFLAARKLLGAVVIVGGSSMDPTFPTDAKLLVKSVPPLIAIGRGDIVVFNDGQGGVIKRVAALPGDRVDFKKSQVFVNGHLLNESYLPPHSFTVSGDAGSHFLLSDDEFVVLGDNRQVSIDSRTYGPISYHQLRGWLPYNGPSLLPLPNNRN